MIDLVTGHTLDVDPNKYNIDYSKRNIQADPSDIDDESDMDRFYRHDTYNTHNTHETQEERRYSIQSVASSKNAAEDASGMYDDISEFERKFRRDDC